jgi:hypothetical protein
MYRIRVLCSFNLVFRNWNLDVKICPACCVLKMQRKKERKKDKRKVAETVLVFGVNLLSPARHIES